MPFRSSASTTGLVVANSTNHQPSGILYELHVFTVWSRADDQGFLARSPLLLLLQHQQLPFVVRVNELHDFFNVTHRMLAEVPVALVDMVFCSNGGKGICIEVFPVAIFAGAMSTFAKEQIGIIATNVTGWNIIIGW
jgi:hypothetical protein